jgi:hypothetical protein
MGDLPGAGGDLLVNSSLCPAATAAATLADGSASAAIPGCPPAESPSTGGPNPPAQPSPAPSQPTPPPSGGGQPAPAGPFPAPAPFTPAGAVIPAPAPALAPAPAPAQLETGTTAPTLPAAEAVPEAAPSTAPVAQADEEVEVAGEQMPGSDTALTPLTTAPGVRPGDSAGISNGQPSVGAGLTNPLGLLNPLTGAPAGDLLLLFMSCAAIVAGSAFVLLGRRRRHTPTA